MNWRRVVVMTILLALIGWTVGGTGGRAASGAAAPSARPVVVAAENFYGDLVGQIAGNHVSIISIISDPNVDPHEYESSASDAAAVARARLVIMNGLGYDDFVTRLMKASPNPARKVIVVAALTGHKTGDNVHLWYDPATMPKVAQAVLDALDEIDPSNRQLYQDWYGLYIASLRQITDRVAEMRAKYQGRPVAFTEPVFGYMAEAIGLKVLTPEAFMHAIEDGNEPPASAIAQMSDQLRTHQVAVLLYNVQTVTPITTNVQRLAKQAGVPIVGVSETAPPGKSYQQWMLSQLNDLDAVLAASK